MGPVVSGDVDIPPGRSLCPGRSGDSETASSASARGLCGCARVGITGSADCAINAVLDRAIKK